MHMVHMRQIDLFCFQECIPRHLCADTLEIETTAAIISTTAKKNQNLSGPTRFGEGTLTYKTSVSEE